MVHLSERCWTTLLRSSEPSRGPQFYTSPWRLGLASITGVNRETNSPNFSPPPPLNSISYSLLRPLSSLTPLFVFSTR
ncbi:hypothetical protein BDZ91DRAFT_726194 [Kalaharituber pfeilii]|nr:hypothetical protein BDZ91DRAFT_726194 [Kalaharituber pfeilii]